MVEYDNLGTQEGRAQFITDRTGLSDKCIRQVLNHLMTQPLAGDEWDLEAQARKAGVSVEEYAVAMRPLMQMSLERAQERLLEVQTQIDRGEDPDLSDEEVEKVKQWEAFVETIASLSGEAHEIVLTILCAVTALTTRQNEIWQELMRLKDSGEGPSGSAL